MTSVEMLADLVTTLANGIHKEVAGLSVPELTWRPDAEGNSIGVTVWHCSRGLDVLKVRFLEQQQALAEQWYTQNWARKTGYDPRGIGTGGLGILSGYTQEEVAAIPVLSAEELLAYLDQVSDALRQYLLSLPEGALSRPTLFVGERLTAYQVIKEIVLGCVGHLGEIEALKALQTRAKQRSPEHSRGEAMSQEHVETVKRLFDAVDQHDQAAILEAYHPEVVIHEAPSLPYGGDYHGHEGALQHVNGFYRTWEALKPGPAGKPPEEVQQENSTVFLETTQEYVVVFGINTAVESQSGRQLAVPEAFVFKMRDGKVAESWMLNQDTVAILEFLKEAQKQIPSNLAKS
jgi:ketosteroid isomerase-like protein